MYPGCFVLFLSHFHIITRRDDAEQSYWLHYYLVSYICAAFFEMSSSKTWMCELARRGKVGLYGGVSALDAFLGFSLKFVTMSLGVEAVVYASFCSGVWIRLSFSRRHRPASLLISVQRNFGACLCPFTQEKKKRWNKMEALTRKYSLWLSVQWWGWAVSSTDVKRLGNGQLASKT